MYEITELTCDIWTLKLRNQSRSIFSLKTGKVTSCERLIVEGSNSLQGPKQIKVKRLQERRQHIQLKPLRTEGETRKTCVKLKANCLSFTQNS